MTTQPISSGSFDSCPRSTRHRVLGVAVSLMVGMPGVALAQSPSQPVVQTQTSSSAWETSERKFSTPPQAVWRRVKPGRKVWVTTNTGSLVHGEVAAISDSSLIIREQGREVTIRIDDVRLVEGRDGLKNGFLIGAASGAVSGGVFFGVLSSALSEGDDSFGAVLFGTASGGAIGGLLGMMVDGLIPGRQTLFKGSTTVVTPVVTPTKKAVDVTIRWQ